MYSTGEKDGIGIDQATSDMLKILLFLASEHKEKEMKADAAKKREDRKNKIC